MSSEIQRPNQEATVGVFPVVEPGHTFATITEKINEAFTQLSDSGRLECILPNTDQPNDSTDIVG